MDRRYAIVTNSLVFGVVVHRADGSIESANPAAERMLGATADQLSGLTPRDPRWRVTREDGSPFPGDEHPASITLRDGVEVRDVVMGVWRGDGQAWLLVTSSPLLDESGRPDGAVATFVDITAERDLRKQLERSVEVLTTMVNEQSALTAAITHDLSAPAAAMRIYADLLLDPDLGATVRRSIVDNLRATAHKTEGLLTDLGAVAGRSASDPRLARAEVDPVAVVQRVVDLADRSVGFEHGDASRAVHVDPVQFERIVDNLLSNAFRHTPDGTDVRVELSLDHDRLRLVVEDDGPGIAAADRERVFQPFERLDASGPGSGLGLFLVQQFAAFHDGAAWCEAAASGGARFVVELPVGGSVGSD